ncbi:MAG: urease accessory protein UreD [Oscillospiraceae bacterium]|nr:urease accessory protein UreD [Oscillospiraceae bacterium]
MSRLYLCAEKRGGRTVIADSFFSSPIKIAKPFYRDDHTEVMMMTASAGMLDGDNYDIEIHVKSGASLKFTGQSFTKIFRSGEKGGASQHIKITVEDGGKLAFLPQPVIPFADSKYDARTDVYLGEKASFIMQDIFSCGRTAMNESFAFKSYRSRTAVYVAGKLVFLDNVRLLPSETKLDGIGHFEGNSHSGMMYIYNTEHANASDVCSTRAYKGECVRILSESAQDITDKFQYNITN